MKNHLMVIASYLNGGEYDSAKAWFQYRVDAVWKPLAVFLREATGIIVILFTLMKFDNLNGWDNYEMLFLFSLLFLTYGVMIIFFTGLRDFGSTVRNGRFDRFILRPRGLLLQIIFANSDWFAAIGHGGLGLVLFLISTGKVGISWNICNALYYIFTVAGGVLIQGDTVFYDICNAFCFCELFSCTVSSAKGRYARISQNIYVSYVCHRNCNVSACISFLAVQHKIL